MQIVPSTPFVEGQNKEANSDDGVSPQKLLILGLYRKTDDLLQASFTFYYFVCLFI